VDAVKYSTLPLVDLLDAFASSDPVPGGGSASALAGALGVSMLLMVAGMTRTRTGAPEEVADLAEASARLRPLRDRLVDLMDRDSDAYRGVIAAFKLAKTTDDEKTTRRDAIQAATKQATEVPLETMRLCQQALQGAAVVARCGNPNAQSDVGVAIELLRAGLRGARMNIEINLPGLTEFAYVERIRGEVQALVLDAEATLPQPPR
jgi:methenyltetrahydrofolate cyclohydrolase